MKKKWFIKDEEGNEIFRVLSVKEVMELSGEELEAYQKDKFEHDTAPLQKQLDDLQAQIDEKGGEADEATKNALTSFKSEIEAIKNYQNELLIQVKAIKDGGKKDGKPENQLLTFIKSEAVQERLKGKSAGFEQLEIKAPELMAVGTVGAGTPSIVGSTDGYSTIVGNYVDTQIGMTPKPMNFILPLVNVTTQPGTEKIWWTERNNEEGDAEFIGEGTLKPLVSAKWETFGADIKEVANHWKMTNRLMKHAPSVMENFRVHANELVDQKIDDQIVTGDGIGNNLAGISTFAAAFVAPPQLAAYYVDANIWDVINACLVTVELANFSSTVIVLNSVWKAVMQGIKATDGVYLTPPFVTPDGRTVSGVPLVFTNKLDDTKILVGDLRRFNVVFSENVMFDEGYENDDFTNNLTSFKLEAFLGTYFKSTDSGSIIYDDIATIIAAIDKP